MRWNFLNKCWLFPTGETLRRRRCKLPPARPHARLCLEQLESRTVPTTITRTSSPIFYNDLSNNLTSAYASYQITNTDGVNYPDVRVNIGNFTAASGQPVVTLAPGAPGAIDLGPLTNGQTKTAFFYLGSNADTTVSQTHTVSVFNGPPASGALLTSQNFSFTSVQGTIQANSNKVNSVVINPSPPTIGGSFTITVTGETGTIGAAKVLAFTPAAYSSWQANTFQMIGSTITFSGANTGTFTDTLLIPPDSITSTVDTSYTAVYTFEAVGTTATPIAVSPVAYISSGTNVKHTTTGNFSTLPPVPPPQLATPTLNTAPTPATVTLGTTPVTLTDMAILADGFNPTGTITFTLVAPGGGTVDSETFKVNGNSTYTTPTGFTLPSRGTVAGTYEWNATYSGDSNNNAVSDLNNVNEQVTVNPASPTLVTTASPPVTLPTAPPGTVTLSDSAELDGGYFPGGSIVFTLTGPGGVVVSTQIDPVSGNGTYMASTTLPTAGQVAGTYTWTASYGGDPNNAAANDQGGIAEQTVVSQASPTLTTTPSPKTVTLGTSPVILTDSATLANGYHPVGTITFTLVAPGGATVDTEKVTVNGNGTYTTPTGFTLPTTGTVIGTYQWDASYSGGPNNTAATDTGASNEQVTVSRASPTIVTTASPNQTLPAGPPGTVTLSDSAQLEGGYSPTGNIVFTLTGPGGFKFTQTVTANGDGTYTASTTLPTTGTVAGTYSWTAHYGGDPDNNTANDQGGIAEQTVVSPASPTLTTTPSPSTLVAGETLKDTAVLAGGYHPTGTITFTLFFNGGATPVDTETVAVNGNGIYTTPAGFVVGAASGSYQWDATYTGDPNNNEASDINDPAEQVTVASPPVTLTTTPTPATVTLGTNTVTLNDTASLAGGVNPTGTITFTLFHNGGGTPVNTETVTVNGDGAYSTPTGFTLPSSGTATGTYQWDAAYSGDANNPAVSDLNNADEQVTVNAASPGLATIASPSDATLGAQALPLKDIALLAGGFHPTGTIKFTLVGPGGTTVDTETVAVNGNGFYRTPAGFTLPSSGTAAGTYQWHATYSGDPNNHTTSEASSSTERVIVNAASPKLTTSPSPSTVTLGTTPVTLTDSATLANGFGPTGTITFTLVAPDGSTADTEKVTVSGNGNYTTPTGFTLPTTGTVTGTYQWNASYSGDTNNDAASDVGATNEQVTVSAASPAITTTPSPTTVALTTATPPTLTDSAFLSGGYHPTGVIIFRLFFDGGTTPLDTEIASVNGDGTYSTPTGFTLPTAGVVVGTYQWDATYSGDGNNISVSDNNAANEQVTVTADTPTFSTTPNPTTVTLGAATPTALTDSATLSGGFNPTGRIFFVLFKVGSSTPLDIEAVSINGNGTYTTRTGFTLPTTGTVTGTYQWDASYSGDFNNFPVVDNDATNEQVTVSPAIPTLVTAASSPVTLPIGPPGTVTLSDSALLSGGFSPTGSIVFTLTGPGGFKFTQTVSVNGDDAYTASTTLPTTGTVAGTYIWTVTYGGDGNNAAANDQGGIAEQTVVRPAGPTLTTIPDPAEATRGATLQDSADLTGGFDPTGDILFSLYAPGVNPTVGPPLYTETVAVNGDGTYHTTVGFASNTGGIWHWLATYSGDSNNNSVSSGPTDEPVTIHPLGDLMVTKTESSFTPNVGDTITYTVTARDNGPDDATGVIVTDLLPAGLTFVSDTASEGSYNSATGVWTIGAMAANTSQTLVIEATVVSPAPQTNTARINGNQFDPNLSNNTASVTETPQQADMMLTKLVNQSNPVFGTPVTYTLIVHNNGPDAATGVVATDVLPVGIMFVSATPSQGAFDPASGRWTIGTLANGASATLQITGTVTATGPITNVASVAALEADPDLANNTSTVTIDGMFARSIFGESLLGQLMEYTMLNPGQTLNPPQLMTQSNQLYGFGSMLVFLDNYVDNINPSLHFLDQLFATYYSVTQLWLETYNNLVDSLGLEILAKPSLPPLPSAASPNV